ncbi:MAG: penicillin-binding protein activator LpoB [Calditrichia bacterium]
MSKTAGIILTVFISLLFFQCASNSRKVTRIETDQVTDLSGRWNDTDARMVAEAMISDLMTYPWINEFRSQNNEKPVVVVGRIRNKSSEHINTEVFTNMIEKELLRSGQVQFIADQSDRQQVREERLDQQQFASLESMKKWANETGADYIMVGSVNSIVDAVEGQKAVFYQIDLELIDVESNTKVWIGDKQIKKMIEQDRYRW